MTGLARGVVEVEVLGKTRKVRLNLGAVAEFEARTKENFLAFLMSLDNPATIRLGLMLTAIEEMVRAGGGAPLTDEERDGALLEDLPAMSQAILAGADASGILGPSTNGSQEKKARAPRRGRSRGTSGRK